MVYGQYPVVFIKGDQNGTLVPSGLAEVSSFPFLSATVLVVSSISALEYQGLNVTASINFTGVLSIGTTGTGIDLALTGDPQNPVIRSLSVGLSNFVVGTAADTISIGWGSQPLDWTHGGTNSADTPGIGGSVVTIEEVAPGVYKTKYPSDFIFDGVNLSIPSGGKYQIDGSDLQIPVNIDDLVDVQITSPTNNQVITWDTGISRWVNKNNVAGGTTIPNIPGRIPYIIDSTTLGSESWFTITTGAGRVNVCSVCAADSAYATTFVEGGTALSTKYLTKAAADTYYQPSGNYQPCDVTLTEISTNTKVTVSRGGTGLTSLSPTGGIFYAGDSTTVSLTPAPQNNKYLKWNGTAYIWDSPTGTGVVINNQPGRIPYIIDSANLGDSNSFRFETGTGRVNVCSVCAADSAYATTFVEGGVSLVSKYQPIGDYQLTGNYQPCDVFLTTLATQDYVNLASNDVCNTLPTGKGGTGLTGFTANSLIYAANTTTLSQISPGSNNTYLKYNAGVFSWDSPTGTGVVINNEPGRIPYIVNATTLGDSNSFRFETGTGRVNVCSVCAADSAYATTFFEGGVSLVSKYQPIGDYQLTGNYQPCDTFLTTLAANDAVRLNTADVTNTLSISNGGTGRTSFTSDRLIYGNDFSQNANLTFDGTTLKSVGVCGTSVCATTFVEGGTSLVNKYQPVGNYQPCDVTLTEISTNTKVTVSRGGTGLTSLTPTGLLYAANSTTVTQTPAPSTNTYLKWNGTAFAWDTPGASLPTTVDADKFLSALSPDKDPYTDGGVYVWIGGAGNATLLGPPDSSQNYVVKFTANGGIKWEPTTEGAFTLAPPELLYTSANYFSALIVDSLSSVDHFNENSTMFYAEANTLNAGTISATNYLNLPSSTMVWASATNATNSVNTERVRKYVKNMTGATIPKGRPVTITGATGDNSLITPLSSVNTHVPEAIGLSNHVFGLTETEIANGSFGYILTEGMLIGTGGGVNAVNTAAFAAGDILYVSSNGLLSNVRPPAPYEPHPIGYVVRSHANVGSIYVKIETVPEINDIVGFNLASSILNGDLISYDLTTSTFVNTQSINVSGSIKGGSLSATNLSATNARITSLSATTVSATTYLNYPVTPAAGTVQGAIQYNTGANGFDADDSFYYLSKILHIQEGGNGGGILTDTINALSISSTTVSATTYLNLPSGTATWNANKIQGISVSSTAPTRSNQLLAYNTSVSSWIAGLAVSSGSGAPTGGVDGDIYIQYFASGDIPCEIGVACSDETTNLTSGVAKATFRMPYTMYLTEVRANVNTAPSGSTILVDVNKNGSTIFSTRVSIDASEKTSVTAATTFVLSTTSLANDDEITVDIDQIGSSTAGKGLKIWLIGTRA